MSKVYSSDRKRRKVSNWKKMSGVKYDFDLTPTDYSRRLDLEELNMMILKYR